MKDLLVLSPIWIAALTGVLTLVLDLLAPRRDPRGFLGYIGAAGLAAAGVASIILWSEGPSLEAPFLRGVLHLDAYAAFFAVLIVFAGAATALFAVHHLPEQRAEHGEFYVLLAFSVVGALSMVAATDLVTLFLGLEVMSLAVYVLCACKKGSPFATEAGMKYFVLGGFASAILLFGIAFLYGATGSLNLLGAAEALARGGETTLPQVALVLFLVAFGFKVAAVPFHLWTPDVYEGAPTPVTVFMAGAIKAAGFAVLGRVVLTAFQAPSFLDIPVTVPGAFLGLSVLTMVVGNVLGIVQDNVKRILAYSSIAHAGYLLLGLYASRDGVNPGVPFYLLTYVVATVGAFGILALLARAGVEDLHLDRVAGLGRRHPVLAALFLVAILSLAGIPPLAGFMGKFYLFREVLRADPDRNVVWVIVAVLNSLVALYYYLRIAVYLYFREPEGEPAGTIRTVPGYVTAGVAAGIALVVGLFPGRFIAASENAARVSILRVASASPEQPDAMKTGVRVVPDMRPLIRSRETLRQLRDMERRSGGVAP